MVHHSGRRRDSLEAGEKTKEYRRKKEKSGCLVLTSLVDLWLNQAHWALRVLCKFNIDLIDVDFQATGCSGCSQKRLVHILPTITIYTMPDAGESIQTLFGTLQSHSIRLSRVCIQKRVVHIVPTINIYLIML